MHPWHLEKDAVWRAGFAHGASYPSLVFNLRGEALGAAEAKSLANGLIEVIAIPGLAEDWAARNATGENGTGFETIVNLLLVAVNHIQRFGGMPVFELGRILNIDGENAQFLVTTTVGPYQSMANVIHWLVTSCELLRSRKPTNEHKGFLLNIIQTIQDGGFGYHSVAHQFIGAATRLGIPFAQLPDRTIEYGQGHLARRMLDTLTDVTPNLSVHLARQKRYAAEIMRDAGIPVPEHFQVENVQQALHAASRLGYPVVVKPADRDGGEAVSADLHTPEEVQQGFAKAVAVSRLVLVEKHVPGRDYRITVFQGQAVWAIERVPGGVHGDGKASVKELVDRLNSDRRAKLGVLKPLLMDAEAHALLRRAGMTEQTVPPAGQFVRLRGAANVASGGVPVAVFEQMHPENAQLAVRAASVIGADIAGIDLLIPDISCSWLESGAHICEVNPGPDIGQMTAAHLFEPLLTSMVEGNGRIPVVLVVGAEPGSAIDRLADGGLEPSGMTIGYSGPQGVRVRDEWLARKPVGSYFAGRFLTRDRRVEAIVMRIDSDDLVTTGLPFARIDVLVVAGSSVTQTATDSAGSRQAMEELVASLLPACDGPVVVLPKAELDLDILKAAAAPDLRTDISEEGFGEFLCEQIGSIAASHRAPKSTASLLPAGRG